jgi:proteasomal ATPase-associated factor 1
MFACSLPSAVNKVIQIGTHSFAAGCQNGQIEVFQLDNISQPLLIKSSTGSSILDMLAHHKSPKSEMSSFWASKSDGSCILINPNVTTCSKIVQLTGPDCDPVYQVKKDLDFIYTACRDGLIRKYSQRVINRLL